MSVDRVYARVMVQWKKLGHEISSISVRNTQPVFLSPS